MKIVKAEEIHREDWLQMRVVLWPECLSHESSLEITSILQDGRQVAFLALEDDGAVIGFIEVSTRDYVEGCQSTPVGYIEGIYVRPVYRRKQIGRKLIQVAEIWAGERGCTEMGSDTAVDNNHSIAFHEAVGFKETDRQVVFLKGITDRPTKC